VSSDDDGYVHHPGDATSQDGPEAGADGPSAAGATPDGFGARGWVLVAVLAACTLVVPGIIYVRPGILSAVGIPYIASLLVLPLLPAVALGLVAVWAMTAATRAEN
jgi:hypothetical protein